MFFFFESDKTFDVEHNLTQTACLRLLAQIALPGIGQAKFVRLITKSQFIFFQESDVLKH